MHPRQIQFDPNAQLNALYAAARAEAKKEAERTRKKLRTFAMALASECSDEGACVVSLAGDDAPQQQSHRQTQGDEKPQSDASKPEAAAAPSSYWA
jgi:hypothetical protein